MAFKERRLLNLRKAIDETGLCQRLVFVRMARDLGPDKLGRMDDIAAEGFYNRDNLLTRHGGKWRWYTAMTLKQAADALILSRLPAEKLPEEVLGTPLSYLWGDL